MGQASLRPHVHTTLSFVHDSYVDLSSTDFLFECAKVTVAAEVWVSVVSIVIDFQTNCYNGDRRLKLIQSSYSPVGPSIRTTYWPIFLSANARTHTLGSTINYSAICIKFAPNFGARIFSTSPIILARPIFR
jgi:hypothetical protein